MTDYTNDKSIKEEIKTKNKRLKAVKNLKISLKVAQLVAPYVIASGISIGAPKLAVGSLPFYRDTFEYPANIMKEFDTLGNESIEKQYSSFESSTNLIRHYTELKKEDTGIYTRQIETYEIDEKDSEEIEKIMKADIDYDELNEILGEPSSVAYETKSNSNNEELKEEDYLQAVVYSIDYDDVLVEKESKKQNIEQTALEGGMCLFLWFVIFLLRREVMNDSFKSFKKQIADIKEKYKPIDEKSLKKEHNKKLVK